MAHFMRRRALRNIALALALAALVSVTRAGPTGNLFMANAGNERVPMTACDDRGEDLDRREMNSRSIGPSNAIKLREL
jgi:hypothetical protein